MAPFGLPSVPAAPLLQPMQASPTTTSSQEIEPAQRHDTQPTQMSQPSTTASSTGKRKTRRDRPQPVKSFNPFTRRCTAPCPLVGATHRSLPKSTSRTPLGAQTTSLTQKGTPPSAAPQESPLLTSSGNLGSPKLTIPPECILNPPFNGSAPEQK